MIFLLATSLFGLLAASQNCPSNNNNLAAGCPVSPQKPSNAQHACNVGGTLPAGADASQISTTLSGSVNVCAQSCLRTPNCKFFSQNNDQTFCALYSKTAESLGFKSSSEPKNATRYFSRDCFFNPETCTFNLKADGGPVDGNFLAVDADVNSQSRYEPTGFDPSAASGTNKATLFTLNSTSNLLTVEQYGQQQYASVIAGDLSYFPSIFQFNTYKEVFGQTSGARALKPVRCVVQYLDQPISCFAPSDARAKNAFYACAGTEGTIDAGQGPRSLRIATPPNILKGEGCFAKDFGLVPTNYKGMT